MTGAGQAVHSELRNVELFDILCGDDISGSLHRFASKIATS